MNQITNLLSDQVVHALGWTFIHSLWQGALLAVSLGIMLVLMRKYSSTTRYRVSIGIMALFFLLGVTTFTTLYNNYQTTIIAETSKVQTIIKVPENISISAEHSQISKRFNNKKKILAEESKLLENKNKSQSWLTFKDYFDTHLPLVVTIWLLGIMVLLLRFLGSMAYVQRLKSYKTTPLPEYWLLAAEQLADALDINASINFLSSKIAITPMAIGVLKPAIILPSKLLTGLTEEQIEAILIHELAHIKRNDYFINILQSLVEIIFFYHPAVWWISSAIRNERENCCDDITITMTGEAYDYASTLVMLEEERKRAIIPSLAMAFFGPKYSFKNRIQRLFESPNTFADFKEGFTTAFIIVGGLLALSYNAWGAQNFIEDQTKNISQRVIDLFDQNKIASTAEGQEKTIDLVAKTQLENGDQIEFTFRSNSKSNQQTDNEDLKLMLEAIEAGQQDKVEDLLEQGLSPNAQTDNGWTPLLQAIEYERVAIVRLLLEKGARVN